MKRKGESLSEQELEELIGQVDSTFKQEGKLQNRTEINFETFKNYVYKLSPMSPSMRQNKFKFQGEANFSMDIGDDDNHWSFIAKRVTSIDSNMNCIEMNENQTSFDIQVESEED